MVLSIKSLKEFLKPTGETREKAIVLYISMLGSTETMIKAMVETLFSEDIEVSLYNLLGADIGEIAKDFVDSRAIVLGMLTMLGGMHPLAGYATYLIKAFRPPLKYGVILSSHGFGGGAVQQAREIFGHMQIEVIGTLDVDGLPTDDDCQNIAEIGKQLSHKMKG